MIEYLNFNDFMNYERLSISRIYSEIQLGRFHEWNSLFPSFWFESHPFDLQILNSVVVFFSFFGFVNEAHVSWQLYVYIHILASGANEFAIHNIEIHWYVYDVYETRNMIIGTKSFIFRNIEILKWIESVHLKKGWEIVSAFFRFLDMDTIDKC